MSTINLPTFSQVAAPVTTGNGSKVLDFAKPANTRNVWEAKGANDRKWVIRLSPSGENMYIITCNGNALMFDASIPETKGYHKDVTNGKSAQGFRLVYSQANSVQIACTCEEALQANDAAPKSKELATTK